MQMTTSPICETPMKKEKRELQKGIFALVEVCPKCEDEWIDEKGYEALYNLFTRKPSKSVAALQSGYQGDCTRGRLERRRRGKDGCQGKENSN